MVVEPIVPFVLTPALEERVKIGLERDAREILLPLLLCPRRKNASAPSSWLFTADSTPRLLELSDSAYFFAP